MKVTLPWNWLSSRSNQAPPLINSNNAPEAFIVDKDQPSNPRPARKPDWPGTRIDDTNDFLNFSIASPTILILLPTTEIFFYNVPNLTDNSSKFKIEKIILT